MTQDIKIFEDTGQIAEEFAATLQKLAQKNNNKPVHVALSGGSTPKAIFKYLSENYGTKLNFPNLHFWWGDDRCVPPTHDDSNFKWANKLWLSPTGFTDVQIHRIKGENNPEAEAKRYAEEIKKFVQTENGWPVFDLILLGLGEDGHTASIFPNQMELLKSDNYCEIATHPQSGQKRVSFTGHLINNAQKVIFLATGTSKSKKVKQVIDERDLSLPATHIKPAKGKLVWWTDNDAAEFIGEL
ncbi:MAG: 6-phosphogluconolactonase [Prolixibacteraceae bacterium]|jgi:6-phosphogluconolactonase|nr:6-phosphogluconolactonase [Prolixibacteraceae bacterium]